MTPLCQRTGCDLPATVMHKVRGPGRVGGWREQWRCAAHETEYQVWLSAFKAPPRPKPHKVLP